MLYGHGFPGTVRYVSVPVVRDELVTTLEESLRVARQLAEDARDDDVPVAELVAQAKAWGQVAWDSAASAETANRRAAEMLQLIAATREYQFG